MRISTTNKDCMPTPEKLQYFFPCVWDRQSAAETSLALFSVMYDEWTVTRSLFETWIKPVSLLSPVRYRVDHSKRNSISPSNHVFSILYLSNKFIRININKITFTIVIFYEWHFDLYQRISRLTSHTPQRLLSLGGRGSELAIWRA